MRPARISSGRPLPVGGSSAPAYVPEVMVDFTDPVEFPANVDLKTTPLNDGFVIWDDASNIRNVNGTTGILAALAAGDTVDLKSGTGVQFVITTPNALPNVAFFDPLITDWLADYDPSDRIFIVNKMKVDVSGAGGWDAYIGAYTGANWTGSIEHLLLGREKNTGEDIVGLVKGTSKASNSVSPVLAHSSQVFLGMELRAGSADFLYLGGSTWPAVPSDMTYWDTGITGHNLSAALGATSPWSAPRVPIFGLGTFGAGVPAVTWEGYRIYRAKRPI